jgi:ferrous iron transport protein A
MNGEKQLSLKDIPMGNRVEIVGYANIDKEYRQKLFSLGLVRGEILRVTKKAPLGDPIEVCLNGSKVSLRKEEATELIVEFREPCGKVCHNGRHHHGGGGNKKRGLGWGRFFHK